MPRQYKLLIQDIIKCIDNVLSYTKGISFDDYLKNQMLQDAILRNLEIIGEAIKNLPEEIVSRDDYFWGRYARMRDLLIHFYFGINHKMGWGMVTTSLPELKKNANALLTEIK